MQDALDAIPSPVKFLTGRARARAVGESGQLHLQRLEYPNLDQFMFEHLGRNLNSRDTALHQARYAALLTGFWTARYRPGAPWKRSLLHESLRNERDRGRVHRLPVVRKRYLERRILDAELLYGDA